MLRFKAEQNGAVTKTQTSDIGLLSNEYKHCLAFYSDTVIQYITILFNSKRPYHTDAVHPGILNVSYLRATQKCWASDDTRGFLSRLDVNKS